MNIEGSPPDIDIPHIWCDLNAVGLSDETADIRYYSLHREILNRLRPIQGMIVFIYDEDVSDTGEAEIFGYVASLEHTTFRGNPHWRARPREDSWYRGPAPWEGG
ncbi:MAG: hypothetical protein V4582_24975 [Pseudomonadota bacterium]